MATSGTSSTPMVRRIWGLGYWAGSAYGFAADGGIYSIDLHTGAATPVATSTHPWWGAAVTTYAQTAPRD